jgi:uncharacterized LabA/DUF88 family protein
MRYPAQRVGVFVDVQNMYYSARALYDQRVDFGEILKEAVGDRHLIRALAYVIEAEKDEEQTFFDALTERGYELRSKPILNFHGGASKGDWDIGIAMDIVGMADKLDVVVLVSGDGDFADLVRYIQSRGVLVEVMAFGSSASSQLREATDALLDLSSDKKFLIPKKRGGRRSPRSNTKKSSSTSRSNTKAKSTSGAKSSKPSRSSSTTSGKKPAAQPRKRTIRRKSSS